MIPPRIDLLDGLADERRAGDREDAHDPGRVTGPGRGVAHVRLQPERKQDDAGEEAAETDRIGRRRSHEAAVAKNLEVDDRVLLGQLPDNEGDEADQRDDPEGPDLRRVEPILVAPFVEHDL